ncbi:MAG TPA: RNA 2',3'-cyclic phosphodiesterase [Kiritimatiellia bacterium]|nr:RNA 2',3'-cyclic phosphodiesterase [Kiritimatiellia bacterium]HPA77975.1 RNA 2',3'-cyclic phosphodiesterase [Kiritimatiellia bacterium]HQQ03844.1 RNA 2',3'-cyclic phosphodiesterase [Kiritimatiellia bacterium]
MSAPNSIRAFIALKPDLDALRSIVKAQKSLRHCPAHVSWTHEDQIHLTLAFLGEISSATADALKPKLDEIAAKYSVHRCRLWGLGTFGPERAPRIVWVGLDCPDPLFRMQKETADACRELGIGLEARDFHPHITIGRIRSARHADSLTSAVRSDRNTPCDPCRFDAVLLMASRPGPQGSRYTILNRSELEGE